MGGGGSEAEVVETKLSKEQADIIKDREDFYQDFTQPSLQQYYKITKDFSLRSDFNTIDDMSAAMDSIFSPEPEERALGQQMFNAGFNEEDIANAQQAQRGVQGKANEQQFSKAKLNAIQQQNALVQQGNQNKLQGQQVRQSGIDALLSKAPGATGAGATPNMIPGQPAGPNPLFAAAGGIGAGLGAYNNAQTKKTDTVTPDAGGGGGGGGGGTDYGV